MGRSTLAHHRSTTCTSEWHILVSSRAPNSHLTLVGLSGSSARAMQQVDNVCELEGQLRRRQAERIRLTLQVTQARDRVSMVVETLCAYPRYHPPNAGGQRRGPRYHEHARRAGFERPGTPPQTRADN
eukprot:m.209683 g.209683  ORF g.209683 m.209683 type:complete len:128 (-) comp18993_c0_seq2:161-544(-)